MTLFRKPRDNNLLGDNTAGFVVVTSKIGEVQLKSGDHLAADMGLLDAPSVFFNAAAIFSSAERLKSILRKPAVDWIRNEFCHVKAIGFFRRSAATFRQGRYCRLL